MYYVLKKNGEHRMKVCNNDRPFKSYNEAKAKAEEYAGKVKDCVYIVCRIDAEVQAVGIRVEEYHR